MACERIQQIGREQAPQNRTTQDRKTRESRCSRIQQLDSIAQRRVHAISRERMGIAMLDAVASCTSRKQRKLKRSRNGEVPANCPEAAGGGGTVSAPPSHAALVGAVPAAETGP